MATTKPAKKATKTPAKKATKKAPPRPPRTSHAGPDLAGPAMLPVENFDPATMTPADVAALAPGGFCSTELGPDGLPTWTGPYPGDNAYPGGVA